MNLPFFAVKAYVPGGVQNQAEKNSKNAFRPVPVHLLFQGLLFNRQGFKSATSREANAGDPEQLRLQNVELEGWEPPLTPKARKSLPVFWALFPLYARDFFPVVRHFLCRFPTEQVLYYRNLGLYYGLASTTLPLYAKPRAKVKGDCLSCDWIIACRRALHMLILRSHAWRLAQPSWGICSERYICCRVKNWSKIWGFIS